MLQRKLNEAAELRDESGDNDFLLEPVIGISPDVGPLDPNGITETDEGIEMLGVEEED